MISVLIPTFNYNVFHLASQIEQSAINANIPFEIICIDDGSQSKLNIENQKINTLQNGKFIASKTNQGLSTNRNNLAKISKYKFLLFVDGDSEIINNNYINNYMESLKKDTDVIFGGRIHPKHVATERKLRWKYGVYHEDSDASVRRKNVYKSTLFNNTLIKKKVFNDILFDETITQYGHEDTIFAYKLSLINANVIHIDNPVQHGDVDLNTVFFNKTHKSLKNLNFIYKKEIIDPSFITFLKMFTKLKKYRLNYLFSFIYKLFNPIFTKNLTSSYPLLCVFNVFRLTYFCNINLKK